MFRKPSMLTALVVIGSAIDRGTLPMAAWWRTMSTPSHALRQSSATRMSPLMNLKRDHCAGLSVDRTSSRLRWYPVAKLSSPTTS
jgi:hypothetical protein